MKKQPAYGKIAKTREEKSGGKQRVFFIFDFIRHFSGAYGIPERPAGKLLQPFRYLLFRACHCSSAFGAVYQRKGKKAALLSGRAAVCISGRLYGCCDGFQQQLVYAAHRRNGNAQSFCHRADDILRFGGSLRLVRYGKKAVPFEAASLLRACNGRDFSGRAGIRRRKQWYFILRQLPMVS